MTLEIEQLFDDANGDLAIGELEEAAVEVPAVYSRWIPISSRVGTRLGMSLMKIGRYPEAIEAGLKCVDLRPNDQLAWSSLSLILRSERKHQGSGSSGRKGPDSFLGRQDQKRMKAAFLFLLAPLVALGQAASPTPPVATRIPLWRCDLQGGVYEVALRSIVSISTHEYVADGVARVTEMNIDTNGNMAVRFYYLEPITPTTPGGIGQSALDRAQALAQQAAGRVNADQIWEKVVKNYPTSTHAHTVEYRLESTGSNPGSFQERGYGLPDHSEYGDSRPLIPGWQAAALVCVRLPAALFSDPDLDHGQIRRGNPADAGGLPESERPDGGEFLLRLAS